MLNGKGLPSAQEAARLLGGEIAGPNQVLCPGPGHSPHDRSLSVRFLPDAPDGFVTHSFAEERTPGSVGRARDYVREKLGMPAWQPRSGNVKTKSTHARKGKLTYAQFQDYLREQMAHGDLALSTRAIAIATGWSQISVVKALRKVKETRPVPSLRAAHAGPTKRTIAAIHAYVDEVGTLLFEVVRYVPKTFLQRRPDGNGDFIWNLQGVRIVPYQLPELIEAIATDKVVFIVEGEKDVDNLAKLDIVATCNAGGAGKWHHEHAAHLKGADVVIIPDNDEPGRQHAESVAVSLAALAARVRTLTLPDLPPKGDVSDWIAAGGTAEQLLALLKQAPDWKPSNQQPSNKPTSQGDDPAHWDVEPWPDVVSGAGLLDAICTILRRYMVLPKHAAEAMALWVLHAWTVDAWEISPLLIVVSPTKQCGKSTLLTILFWVTPRSELISNATASPIFRLIEDAKPAVPTFLLDEGDSYLKPDKEDLRGILNSGWMRAGARVIRTEGDGGKRQARRFSTWAPKVIGTIKAVADTLMDRGVIVTLRRKTKSEKVTRFRMRDTDEFAKLRRQARRWADDNVIELRDVDPAIPAALQNRPADNWRALIAVSDAAGGNWGSRAREAAEKLTGAKSDDDKGIELLRDVRRVFHKTKGEWLGAKVLLGYLLDLEDAPWLEWRNGSPISTRGIFNILKDYGIKPRHEREANRYYKMDFDEAWQSYLPEPEADNQSGEGPAS